MSAPAPQLLTLPAPRPVGRPRLRLVPLPPVGPPLLDGPTALVLPGPGVRAPQPTPGPRPSVDVVGADDEGWFGTEWTVRTALPDPRQVGRQVITLALEAFADRRPLRQVQGAVTAGLFQSLTHGNRPAWCSAGGGPLVVGRLQVCEPVDGVAEISAVAHRAGRAHAVAARLEGIDGRWRCTALQVG